MFSRWCCRWYAGGGAGNNSSLTMSDKGDNACMRTHANGNGDGIGDSDGNGDGSGNYNCNEDGDCDR